MERDVCSCISLPTCLSGSMHATGCVDVLSCTMVIRLDSRMFRVMHRYSLVNRYVTLSECAGVGG